MAPHTLHKEKSDHSDEGNSDGSASSDAIVRNKTKKSAKERKRTIESSDSDDFYYAGEIKVKRNKYERTRLANVLDWHKQFWKIGRTKFVNQLYLCKDCQEYNHKMGDDRFETRKERLIFKQSLCKKCALLNIDVTNKMLHHAEENYPDNAYKN